MAYFASLLPLAGIYGILVLGLNLQYGMTGILNFTYITFVAMGAYVSGVLSLGNPTNQQTYIMGAHIPFPLNIIAGGLAAGLLGLAISFTTLRRLRSDYLAIVTIAAGQIVYTIIGNERGIFNGWDGIFNIPVPAPAGLGATDQQLFFGVVTVIILALTFIFVERLQRSPLGRTLRSIREDETVTSAFGRNTYRLKLEVFFIGSFIAGVGGALLGEYATAYNPSAFLPGETFILWAALLIGGLANNWGALLGALIVPVGFTEVTRFLPSSIDSSLVQSVRGMMIGALIIVVPLVLPHGILRERFARYRAPAQPITEPPSAPPTAPGERVHV
ncbi:MAG: branched-chain amino acid ABC transporter permease [Chloroflexota bacterium]